jgi:prepilin-type N-terminal cleavage/methylation domain-containing protein
MDARHEGTPLDERMCIMSTGSRNGFTIIESLVVVSIIALLIGILLPAISTARDSVRQAVSLTNLRNMATAHATVADNIADYGSSSDTAFPAYLAVHGVGHPNIIVGWGPDRCGQSQLLYQYMLDGTCSPDHAWAGNAVHWYGSPFSTVYGFGRFRFPNIQAFNQYLGGRWYSPEFYAPKDTQAYSCVEEAFDIPYEVVPQPLLPCARERVWSSYCLSPAGMLNPNALSLNTDTARYYRDPWAMPAGLRTPAMSQALHPALKTHMLEHHWLQNRRLECNDAFTGSGTTGGCKDPTYCCEPHYFNHGRQSSPMALFYDGHAGQVGVRTAELADARMFEQSGHGLWSRDTPMGGDPPGTSGAGGGYFVALAYDEANTSFHILTTDGIRGRDTLVQ